MEIGTSFPLFEFGTDAGAIKAFAVAADELGYQHLSCIDHVLGVDKSSHPDYNPIPRFVAHYFLYNQFHEMFTLFSYMAAATSRIRFFTGILILPQRQTALVAKQAAEVDILSKGRLSLGVAVGHTDIEYKGLGMEFENRGSRIIEQIEVLRMLWTQPVVHFRGKYHDLDGVGINPLPVQRPIPIWMGGWRDPVLKRAARIANGIVAPMKPISELKQLVAEAGRDPNKFGFTGGVGAGPGDLSKAVVAARAQQERGVTMLSVSTGGNNYTIDQHIDALRRFKATYGSF